MKKKQKHVTPGSRVKLLSTSHVLHLRNPHGQILRPGEWDGYYVILLDEPAVYIHADGSKEAISEIRELADNFVVIASAPNESVGLHKG